MWSLISGPVIYCKDITSTEFEMSLKIKLYKTTKMSKTIEN